MKNHSYQCCIRLGSRVTDLLESLGLDEHIIQIASDFKTMSQFEIKDKAVLRESALISLRKIHGFS